MRILYVFGEKRHNNVIEKESVRGILLTEDGKVLMLYSEKNHDFSFPGGTKEEGESDEETLAREVQEETGYEVELSSLKEFGEGELWKPDDNEGNTDFHQVNRYYFFQGKLKWPPKLTDNEERDGIHAVIIHPQNAIERNQTLLNKGYHWIPRELAVLEKLKVLINSEY